MPNDAELARTGLSFTNGFCNTSMCSPSRATLLSGRYPAEHGVTLTLTAADLRPDPRNTPAVVAEMRGILSRREAPARRVLTQFARGALRLGSSTGNETELPSTLPTLAGLLRAGGYEVAYKGKWHLTHPSGSEGSLLGGWSARDAERLEREYGFADWDPPDAGENAKAEHFGGGNAVTGRAGTRSTRARSRAGSRRRSCRSPSASSSR
jgi:arylsulfatase A-like enzyme